MTGPTNGRRAVCTHSLPFTLFTPSLLWSDFLGGNLLLRTCTPCVFPLPPPFAHAHQTEPSLSWFTGGKRTLTLNPTRRDFERHWLLPLRGYSTAPSMCQSLLYPHTLSLSQREEPWRESSSALPCPSITHTNVMNCSLTEPEPAHMKAKNSRQHGWRAELKEFIKCTRPSNSGALDVRQKYTILRRHTAGYIFRK